MITMRDTEEYILTALSNINGLRNHNYGIYPSKTDKYIVPGNYVYAKNVERGIEQDKFNWVACSFYEENNGIISDNLKTQLKQLFDTDKLFHDTHIVINQDKDGIIYYVEYQFHTFGTESISDDGYPDFCSSCGWNITQLKCNAGPDDHPSESCHYICSNCGENTGIIAPCIRKIVLNVQFESETYVVQSENIISDIGPTVANAISEIILSYAAIENNLQAMLSGACGYGPNTRLASSIKYIEANKDQIVSSISDKSVGIGRATSICIDNIIAIFRETIDKRNTLAHGKMERVDCATSTTTNGGFYIQMKHNDETLDLTEIGMRDILANIRKFKGLVERFGHLLKLSEYL